MKGNVASHGEKLACLDSEDALFRSPQVDRWIRGRTWGRTCCGDACSFFWCSQLQALDGDSRASLATLEPRRSRRGCVQVAHLLSDARLFQNDNHLKADFFSLSGSWPKSSLENREVLGGFFRGFFLPVFCQGKGPDKKSTKESTKKSTAKTKHQNARRSSGQGCPWNNRRQLRTPHPLPVGIPRPRPPGFDSVEWRPGLQCFLTRSAPETEDPHQPLLRLFFSDIGSNLENPNLLKEGV